MIPQEIVEYVTKSERHEVEHFIRQCRMNSHHLIPQSILVDNVMNSVEPMSVISDDEQLMMETLIR